jgi:hypothetical protein
MSLTFIDTNKLSRKSTPGHGEMTEVRMRRSCGAKNVRSAACAGLRRAIRSGPKLANKHQLVYLMEGKGRITPRR